MSHGRAGWNALTSSSEGVAANYGARLPSSADRYGRVHEAIELVQAVWGSWGEDAWTHEELTNQFTDAAQMLPNGGGHFVASRGPLPIPPSERANVWCSTRAVAEWSGPRGTPCQYAHRCRSRGGAIRCTGPIAYDWKADQAATRRPDIRLRTSRTRRRLAASFGVPSAWLGERRIGLTARITGQAPTHVAPLRVTHTGL